MKKLMFFTYFAHDISHVQIEKFRHTVCLCFRDAIVLFRPKHLHNKFEPNSVKYEGASKKEDIESWINKN